MKRYTLTIGQLTLTNPQDVYRQIHTTFTEHPQTDLFVFPEFAAQDQVSLGDIPYLQDNPEAQKTARQWLDLVPDYAEVKALSDQTGKAVLSGSLAQENRQLYSRAYYYDPQEHQLSSYDKCHVHWTETFLRPGDVIAPVQTRFGRIGILICYDMAFIEPARVLGIQGAEVLFALSAIPMDFHWRYHHHRMTGAAIFSQYYGIAANLGYSLKAPMGGYSGVYSPEGDLVTQIKGSDYGTLSAQIDLDLVATWREKEMIRPYRKPRLYSAITAPLNEE
jgi:predicted amidohydrolase